jgi:hypothetical protein
MPPGCRWSKGRCKLGGDAITQEITMFGIVEYALDADIGGESSLKGQLFSASPPLDAPAVLCPKT